MQLPVVDPLFLYILYMAGILVVFFLPRSVAVLFFAFMLFFCSLWLTARLGSIPITDGAPLVRAPAQRDLLRGLKFLTGYYGAGLALLLFERMAAWNWRKRFKGFLGKEEQTALEVSDSHAKDKRAQKGGYWDVCGSVLWGWLAAIIVMMPTPYFLPRLFGGLFVPSIVVILFQSAIIHHTLVRDRTSGGYRLLTTLGGIFLGASFALIPYLVFRGINMQPLPSYLRSPYYLDSTLTLLFIAGISVIPGIFLGIILFMKFGKNTALTGYGILMFIPAFIAAYPPIMVVYIGKRSLANFPDYQSILYFPLAISLGCIVVAVKNMFRARKVQK